MKMQEERSSWRSYVGAGVTVLLLCVTGTLLVAARGWRQGLSVASVVVEGARIVSPQEIVSLAAIVRGGKLFAVDLGQVKKRVEQNPFVRSASVERDAPDRITIIIEEREPLAAAVGGGTVYLDADGYVLPQVRSDRLFDLPVVTGAVSAADCIPGRRIVAGDVQEALSLLKSAKLISDEAYRRISEVHADEQHDMILYTAEYGIPVIVGHGDEAEKLLKLDAFWKDVVGRRGAEGLQYIDLRFEDQIVVRWDHGADGAE